MRYPIAISALSALLLASCATQAALVKNRTDLNEVRGEVKQVRSDLKDIQGIQSRLDRLEAAAKGTAELQSSIADYGVRFDQLTTDIQILQGKLEENNFKLAELSQKLDDKTFRIAELSGKLDELEARIKTLEAGPPPADAEGAKKQSGAQAPGPSEAYRQAKADFDKGNFDLAIAGFEHYLAQFPDASQADMAQYWIGECRYSKKEYAKAIEEFSRVIKKYPKSSKVAGAKLKIGYAYQNEKNSVKAKEWLRKVVKDHPASKEAELAKNRLSKLQ